MASPVAAEIRISEVLANPLGSDVGLQKVELDNFGPSAADIGGWRICNELDYLSLPIPTHLSPGESFIIHVAANGASDDRNFYTGDGWAALGVTEGAFALYGPTGGFDEAGAMKDFVQWGAEGQPRESVADAAGIWPVDDFVELPSEGDSIQLCTLQASGSAAWLEGRETLGGENNCSTEAKVSTWGAVKGIYR
jgi:hypothetical protein